MNQRHEELLRLLEQASGPMTAKELSACMHVSVRTLKTYVAQINADGPIVSSGKHGYTLSAQKRPHPAPRPVASVAPQNYAERAALLIKRLLIDRIYVDIYELASLMCISDTTCRSDISRMNKTYEGFHLKFSVEHDFPQVKGAEKDKRRLIRHVITQEAQGEFLSLSLLQNWFDRLDVARVAALLDGALAENGCQVNALSRNYLVFNLVIMLTRVTECKYLATSVQPSERRDREYQAALDLSRRMAEVFHIQLREQEINDLCFLIAANAREDAIDRAERLEDRAGADVVDFVQESLQAIRAHYFITLDGEAFLTPFCLHIKKLLMRLRRQDRLSNPMAASIKAAYPLLFDIAAFFAARFEAQYGFPLGEDEIACLALHFGGALEKRVQPDGKLRAVLLCPDYLDMRDRLAAQILEELGGKLEIVQQISSLEELGGEADLLISTVHLKEELPIPVYTVAPFLTSADKRKLYGGVEEALERRGNHILAQVFDRYFSSPLFFPNVGPSDREHCISFLCSKLCAAGYVDGRFLEQVLYRESLSSTAFYNLAIPHAMSMDASRTGICVLLSPAGIQWGTEKKVNVVLLAALSEEDKPTFSAFYESVVKVFSSVDFLLSITRCPSFEDFRAAFLAAV